MFLRFIQSQWFKTLFTAAITIIAVIMTQRIVTGRENSDSLKDEFAKRPTYDYVNQQDENIKTYVIQHVEESGKADQNVMDYMKSIDRKIDIILSRQR